MYPKCMTSTEIFPLSETKKNEFQFCAYLNVVHVYISYIFLYPDRNYTICYTGDLKH